MRDARAYVKLSKSLNDLAYFGFHKNPLLVLQAAPDAVPMVVFKTRFPGRCALLVALIPQYGAVYANKRLRVTVTVKKYILFLKVRV
jgi:hypothetical protein